MFSMHFMTYFCFFVEDGCDGNKTEQNPFMMPDDDNIFQFRKTEKTRRKLVRDPVDTQ